MSKLRSVWKLIGRVTLIGVICTGLLTAAFLGYAFVCFVIGGIRTYSKDLTTAQVSGLYICHERDVRGRLIMRPDGTFLQTAIPRDGQPVSVSGRWSFASWEKRKRTVHLDRFVAHEGDRLAVRSDLSTTPEWFFTDFRIGFDDQGLKYTKTEDAAPRWQD